MACVRFTSLVKRGTAWMEFGGMPVAINQRIMMCGFTPAIFLIVSIFLVHSNDASEILRPRGVSISKASFYVPEKDFICFDGSATVPFTYVNDDYCDCEDGSDEPGTAACPNGTFHCTNAGHRPLNIPSSRVNDGICDCCDTSDEYASQASCINNCNDLGRAARVEAQKMAELRKQGSEMKVQLSKRGKQIRQEKQDRLAELERSKDEAEKIKQEKESLKLAAELLENDALEKYRKIEEEDKERERERLEILEERESFEFFRKIDSNHNSKLEIFEIQSQQKFDQNRDGIVSDEEAKHFLGGRDELTWSDYFTIGWPLHKPLAVLDKGMFVPPTQEPTEEGDSTPDADTQSEATTEHADPSEGSDENDEEDDDEEHEFDDEHKSFDGDADENDKDPQGEDEEEEEDGNTTEEPLPKYDDETQKLIDVASRARTQFEEADRAVRDIQREIQQIKDSIEKDYGPDEEFAPLDGECFEYTDTEYIYRLCPFDQATQRSKSGGSDTRLGTWSGWVGPQGDRYLVMLYDKGQSCWNGPQRSTHVKLSCGTDNAITSVSEPNRCEYLFEFTTPAICQPGEVSEPPHDEL